MTTTDQPTWCCIECGATTTGSFHKCGFTDSQTFNYSASGAGMSAARRGSSTPLAAPHLTCTNTTRNGLIIRHPRKEIPSTPARTTGRTTP